MRIERVRVRNLRALEDVEVGLDPNLTVVIGANNAGKTTLLDAIGAVVSYSGRVPFTELDFRSTSASSDLRDAPPIVIDLWLAPPSGQQRFESGAVAPVTPQIVGDGERVLLRLEVLLVPDASTSAPDLTARLVLLRPDGSEIEETVRSAFPFRDQLPFRAFGPDRDLRRGLGGRWSDWGTLLAEARPDPPTTAAALELLRQGSDKLVSGTPLIGELAESLSRIGPVLGLPSNTVVTLSAAPRDVDEMLRALAIDVTSPADQRGFGADRHGLGTQGALLFGIYAHQVERLSKRDRVRPILTIEEPEAHLHPTAQRAMAGRLSGMPGQVIASSHSPELLLTGSVILLRTVNGQARAFSVPGDHRFVLDHPRALFARSIVLAEGLESRALPLCAKAIGYDLHAEGIEVVNATGDGAILKLRAFFMALGLPVVVVCDHDVETRIDSLLATVDPEGSGSPTDRLERHGVFTPGVGMNVECLLCANAPDVVEAILAEDGTPYAELRASDDRVPKNQRRRISLRGGGEAPETVAECSDDDARVVLLARAKSEIVRVFARLTANGTDGTRVPDCYRRAVERAVENARNP